MDGDTVGFRAHRCKGGSDEGCTAPMAMALEGRLAQASISFGQWQTEPPLDRFPNNSPIAGNNHELIPAHKPRQNIIYLRGE